MSYNLIAAVEQADDRNIVRPMILTRVIAGLTNTATIGRGDVIDFSGLSAEVTSILHSHQPLASEIAPGSKAIVNFTRPLTDREIALLRAHGWRDMPPGD